MVSQACIVRGSVLLFISLRILNARLKVTDIGRPSGTATTTGILASNNSVEVMREIGIDLSGYRSTSIKAILLSEIDLFVPMTYVHAMTLMQLGVPKDKIYIFSHDISDPYFGDLDLYRFTRDEIYEQLKGLLDFVERK